jgi:tetratricopeptide (TPR) repeat protein
MQQFEKAIEYYKAALNIDHSLMWGWVDLSSSHYSLGQHAESLRVLEDAHSRIPYDGPIAHALARLLATTPILEKRQGKRALKLALKVYGALESYTHAKTVAMAYAQLNKCNKAVEWMEKAIELAKKSSQDAAILQNLRSNLEYFKTQRPCRVPTNQ